MKDQRIDIIRFKVYDLVVQSELILQAACYSCVTIRIFIDNEEKSRQPSAFYKSQISPQDGPDVTRAGV